MSTKRTRRGQKKAERTRKKAKTRAKHASRVGTSTGTVGMKSASKWPLFDCYLSSNWHERGAKVTAAFARKSARGQVAAAFLEIDLEELGVTTTDTRTNLTEDGYGFLLSEKSADDSPLLCVSPSLVVKVAREGAEWGGQQGHPLPPGYPDAAQLFAGVDTSKQQISLLFGAEDEPEPIESPLKESWWGVLKTRLGRRPQ